MSCRKQTCSYVVARETAVCQELPALDFLNEMCSISHYRELSCYFTISLILSKYHQHKIRFDEIPFHIVVTQYVTGTSGNYERIWNNSLSEFFQLLILDRHVTLDITLHRKCN